MNDKMQDAYRRFMETPMDSRKVAAVFTDRTGLSFELSGDTVEDVEKKARGVRASWGSLPMLTSLMEGGRRYTQEEMETLHAEWNTPHTEYGQ